MLEKAIELKLVKEVGKNKGLCLKLVCAGFFGMPDRMVLLPKGKLGFVEVKAPGKKPRAMQIVRHKQLRALGFKVYVLDGEEQIERIIDEIRGA